LSPEPDKRINIFYVENGERILIVRTKTQSLGDGFRPVFHVLLVSMYYPEKWARGTEDFIFGSMSDLTTPARVCEPVLFNFSF
jgi:hypothetical protein